MKTTAGAGKTSLGPTEGSVHRRACRLRPPGPRLPYAAAAMPDSAGGGIGLGPGPEGGLAPPAPPGVTTPLYCVHSTVCKHLESMLPCDSYRRP